MNAILSHLKQLLRRLLRPLVRRVDAHLAGVMAGVIREVNTESCVYELAHLSNVREELLHHIGTLGRRLEFIRERDPYENEVVLDSVLRELIRLQRRVDLIVETLDQHMGQRDEAGRESAGREPRPRQAQAA
ncbi:MAG: hypothetical protein K1X74_00155 [Pirellulales bacterium]|nr:hypothetical protein [Pirellulales bacterium]